MLLMWRGLCTSLPEFTWAGHLQSGHELKAAVTMVCSPLHENQQGMYNWVTKEFINLSWIYFSGALYTVRTSLKAIITKECVHQVEIISVGVCTIWTRTESHSYQGICSPVEIQWVLGTIETSLKAAVPREFVHQWKLLQRVLGTIETSLKAAVPREFVHQWKLLQWACVQLGQQLKAVVSLDWFTCGNYFKHLKTVVTMENVHLQKYLSRVYMYNE